jgi:hypothetical protein
MKQIQSEQYSKLGPGLRFCDSTNDEFSRLVLAKNITTKVAGAITAAAHD